MTVVEIVVSHPSLLGECPLWSPTEGLLYWIDIEGRQIHRYDPTTGRNETQGVSARPGSIALTDEPGVLLVAMEHELVWFRWQTGELKSFVALEPEGNGNRLNDGRTDPAGRFVVGSMWSNPGDGRSTGSLYSVEGDGAFNVVRTTIGVTNGLAFDPIREWAYFADTFTKKVIRWNYDVEAARRSNEIVFCDYQNLPGLPDGACVDADGCYWSASVYGWSVVRITPDGKIDRRIELPLEKPSMPAFGGPKLDTLFITTIGSEGGRPSKPGKDGAIPGSLVAVDAGVLGLPETPFAGSPVF
ncbi:MAG: SMP-30/gluconolactonase/LRE family protein [Acidimicrobiales bacterium]|nr:SMP-30/gluconolactonase/LRE family protein [Acidimicrobiales bacterium]